MRAEQKSGRWVILVGDHDAPVFWSDCRETLEHTCEVMKRTCPSARVVWQSARHPARLGSHAHAAGLSSRD